MAFLGPTILGTAALIADNEVKRREALAEGDALLAAGAVFHNHLMFGRDAIEACLEMGDWDRAERYALELAACTRAEPLPLSDFFVARGQALAAVGRGCARANRAILESLINEAERAGYLLALPALRKAADLSAPRCDFETVIPEPRALVLRFRGSNHIHASINLVLEERTSS